MTKQDYVEVTVKLPKKLVDTIEALKYFGWSKDEFFFEAVRGYLSSCTCSMDYRFMHKIENKYGEQFFCCSLPPIFEPEEMLQRL